MAGVPPPHHVRPFSSAPGCVSTEVLEHALTTYGSDKLTPEEAAELLATVDPENTGRINYMEFINMMSTN